METGKAAGIAIYACGALADHLMMEQLIDNRQVPYSVNELRQARDILTEGKQIAEDPDVVLLEEIIDQCLQDSVNWFPRNADDVPFLTLALCGEIGELANLIKKVERGTHTYKELEEKIHCELVDAFIYMMNLVGVLNIDLIEKYKAVRAKNLERFGNVAA